MSATPRPTRFFLRPAMVPLAVALLASLAAPLHPALDSLAHFRLHLAVLLALACLSAWVNGLRRQALSGLAILALAAVWTAPFLPGAAMSKAAAGPDGLRIVQFNAHSGNRAIATAAAHIRGFAPDVIIIQEAKFGPGGLADLLSDAWPVRARCRYPIWQGGILVLSRWPAIDDPAHACSSDSRLAAVRLLVRGKPVTFASLHLKWPWPINQAGQIDRLAPILAGLPHPLVLGGDFNAAPWSQAVSRVAALTGTRIAPGLRPSWLFLKAPDALRPAVGLPIDHVLVSEGIRIRTIRTGPSSGSDHLPVIADLALRQ